MLIVCSLAISGFLFLIVINYNEAQKAIELVHQTLANVAIMLQKRIDLINKLIETTQNLATHEKLVLVCTAEEETISALVSAGFQADSTMMRLNSALQRNPQLLLNAGFKCLMADLAKLEAKEQTRRETYNRAVMEYNTLCSAIPFVLAARAFGFKPATYFNSSIGHLLKNRAASNDPTVFTIPQKKDIKDTDFTNLLSHLEN